MKGSGLIISKMGKARKHLIMDRSISEILLMAKSMERGILSGLIILSISENGRKILFLVKVRINRPMGVSLRDNGLKVLYMAKESIDMETEKYTKEIMSMTKERDGASINGLMAQRTMVNGSKTNNTASAALSITTAPQNLVNGKKAPVSNGSPTETK